MSPRNSTRNRALGLLFGGGSLLAILVYWLLPERPAAITIGVEAGRVVSIGGEELHAVPYTHGDPLAVRIASAVPEGRGYRYDLRFMAYGPGEHDLSQYLVDHDGKPASNVPNRIVAVKALLPADYSGVLYDNPETPIDLHSRYPLVMALLWGMWALLLIPLVLYGRRRRGYAATAPPPPGVPERLRTLLETAVRGPLKVEQRADLEQLLLTFWAERLEVRTGSLVETLQQLRQHPTAGPQVHSVEQWLHGREAPIHGNVARELLTELGWRAAESRPGARGR